MSGYTSYEEMKRQIIEENEALSEERSGSSTSRRSFAVSTWFMDSLLVLMITLLAYGFPPSDGSLNLENFDAEKGLELVQQYIGDTATTTAVEGIVNGGH